MNSNTTKKNRTGLVVGAIALAVACSGGAYAAGAAINSSAQIKSGVVNTGDIKNGTIKVKDLNKKTVTAVNKIQGWTDASLQAPWAQFPSTNTAGSRADVVNGVVYLRGAVSFSSDNGSDKEIFELPAGHRPANTVYVKVLTKAVLGGESTFGALEIQPDGDVRILGEGDDRFVSFEGVSFSIG